MTANTQHNSDNTLTITLSPEILKASNDRMAIGAIVCNAPSTYTTESLDNLRAQLTKTWEKHANKSKEAIREIPGVKALRGTYKALGKNPNKFIGSNEALLLRAAKGQHPKSFHGIVDVNNLLSVKFCRSIGTYDLEKTGREFVFRKGKKGECYDKINGRKLDLENLPILADEMGAFGSPTSDSTRAVVLEETRRFVFCVFSFDGREELEAQIKEIEEMLVGVLGCSLDGFC